MFSLLVRSYDEQDYLIQEKVTSVNAKDLIVNDGAEGEEVEHVGKVAPDIRRAVFSDTFRVEPISLFALVRTMLWACIVKST